MLYIILAVLLTIMQATPPVPREAPDPSNGTAQNVKADPNSNKAPSQQPQTIVQPIRPNPEQDNSHSPATENAQKPVIVRELPPVSVMKDWWDRIYIAFTGLLIIVGIIGVRAAYKTLGEIKAQRKQTDEIIENMRDTAVRQLRAYVSISKADIAFIQERAPEVQVHIKNSGKTPAYKVQMWIGIGHGPYPIIGTLPPPPPQFQTSSSILGPGEKPQAMRRQYPAFAEESMPILGTPELTLFVYGQITYRDAFDIERHTEYRLIFGGTESHPLRNENGIGVAFLRADTQGNDAD